MGSSYRLFWKSYGYHHNRYEHQPGTHKVLMAYFGNLQVTSEIGTKRCLEQPTFAGLCWQSCDHQYNWYEKTLGAAKIRISYFGKSYGNHHNRYENQPGTFEVLMDYIGNLQVTSKIGTTKNSWYNQNPYRLFWQSYGWRHNRYENKLEIDSMYVQNQHRWCKHCLINS